MLYGLVFCGLVLGFQKINGGRYVRSYFVSCFHIINMFRMTYMQLSFGIRAILDLLS